MELTLQPLVVVTSHQRHSEFVIDQAEVVNVVI